MKNKREKLKGILDKLGPTPMEGAFDSFSKDLNNSTSEFMENMASHAFDKIGAELNRLRGSMKPLSQAFKELTELVNESGDELTSKLEKGMRESRDSVLQQTRMTNTLSSRVSEISNNLGSSNQNISKLSEELERAKKAIQGMKNSFEESISSKEKKTTEDLNVTRSTLNQSISSFKEELSKVKEGLSSNKKTTEELSDLIDKKTNNLRLDILEKLSNVGGGNANRSITFDSVQTLSKYTDINFITSSSISIATVNNDTTKKVDVTISAVAAGVTAFTDLSDVPSTYSGQTGKILQVNAGETGLEFVTNSQTADWNTLTNIPGSISALASYNTNGLITQTSQNTYTGRTLTGTSNEITVTNGNGVSGNPTISLPAALTFTGKTVTGGTFTGITDIAVVDGGTGLSAGTSGGIPYYSASTTMASSGALTASAIILGGGAGASPTSLALGTANRLLGMNSGATAHEYKTVSVANTGSTFSTTNAANSLQINIPTVTASNAGVLSTGSDTFDGIKTSTNLIKYGSDLSGSYDARTLIDKTYADLLGLMTNPALYKNACTCATTTNITLSGEQTIDGFATSATRVLVWSQNTLSQNGIYISNSGAWTRASDYDNVAETLQGTSTFILDGTVNKNRLFAMNSATPTTLGTDQITFTPIAGSFSALNFFVSTTDTGTHDFSVTTSGNNVTYNLPTASATVRGALSSSDWSTFNSKASVSGATVINDIAIFSNTTGEITDSGMSISSSGGIATFKGKTSNALKIIPNSTSGGAASTRTVYIVGTNSDGTSPSVAANPSTTAGGDLYFVAGNAMGATGTGGTVTIGGGTGAASGTGNGGDVQILGGTHSGSGVDGIVTISGSSISSSSSSSGASFEIVDDITVYPATGFNFGIADPLSLFKAFLDTAVLTADRTFAFPDQSGTFALTSDLAGATATDVQIFTSSGTWTKPANAKSVHVVMIGGGGGGGSGRKGAASTVRGGGGGGGGGGWGSISLPASILGSTETVSVGTGGAGGASRTTSDTNGAAGTTGLISSFGAWLQVIGGTGAAGGSTGTSSGGAGGLGFPSVSQYTTPAFGGASSGTGGVGAVGSSSFYCPASGGAGGGITSANAASAGGDGGRVGTGSGYKTAIAAGLGGASSTNGTNGTSSPSNSPVGGGAGGGGGGSTTTNAGTGGNGGSYGAGGGGGGAATNAVGNSGAGGNGANGIVIVTTYF